MPSLDRRPGVRGPMFWMGDETIMFVNHFDASTRDGPREASEDDSLAHPEAFSVFKAKWEAEEAARRNQIATRQFNPVPLDEQPPGLPLIRWSDPKSKPAPAPKPYAERRNASARG